MKQLTPKQKLDIYGFLYVVLSVHPVISEAELYKKLLHFAKSEKMPIKAVKEFLKRGEPK